VRRMMAEADLKPREPGKTLAEKKKKTSMITS
jgi:hypothetical protein